MWYKHKNKGTEIVRIHDYQNLAYDLDKDDEVIINKASPRETVYLIEQVEDIGKEKANEVYRPRKARKSKKEDDEIKDMEDD